MTAQGGGPRTACREATQFLALLRDMNTQVSVAAFAVVTPVSLACLQLRDLPCPLPGLQPCDVRSKVDCERAGSVVSSG